LFILFGVCFCQAKNRIEIVLVEDNPSDLELTLHALKKHNLANHIEILRDGAEALELFLGQKAQPM
jgi:two-component system, response regulator